MTDKETLKIISSFVRPPDPDAPQDPVMKPGFLTPETLREAMDLCLNPPPRQKRPYVFPPGYSAKEYEAAARFLDSCLGKF